MAGIPGPVHYQHGWQADVDAGATVQTNEAAEGLQACEVTETSLFHEFADARAEAWLTLRLRPRPSAAFTDVPDGASAVFWVNDAGNIVAYSNRTPVELAQGHVDPDAWSRFDLRLDYATQRWSLWHNSVPVLREFPFYGGLRSGLTRLTVLDGPEAGASLVDDVTIDVVSPWHDWGSVLLVR
jgi:hypothetical protein